MSDASDKPPLSTTERHLFDARMTAGLVAASIAYPLVLQTILTGERIVERLSLPLPGYTPLGVAWRMLADGVGLLFGGAMNALMSVIPSVVATMVLGAMVWVAANMVVSITRLRVEPTCFAASVVGWTGFLATFALARIMAPDFSIATGGEIWEFVRILLLGPALATVVGQFCGAVRTWPDDPAEVPRLAVRFTIGQLLAVTSIVALLLAALKVTGLLDPAGLVIVMVWLFFQAGTLWIVFGLLQWSQWGHRLRDVPPLVMPSRRHK